MHRALSLALLPLLACGELPSGYEAEQLADGGADEPAISFTDDVQPVLDQHCVQCHSPATGGVSLQAGDAYTTLTTRTSGLCDLPLVTPGAPEESALWVKLTEDISAPSLSCGREMPPLGEGSLLFVDPEAAEVLRLWIAQGAPPDLQESDGE